MILALKFDSDTSWRKLMELESLNFIDRQTINENQNSIQTKSSSLENLLSQNEDLMARLKVLTRRLAAIEEENQNLKNETEKMRTSYHAYSDQMMILKEKDKIWKNKLDQAELDRDKHIEKSQNLEQKLSQAKSEIERHVKYHEKIKTQVKPYITQLKEYCKSLESKNADLQNTNQHREAQIHDIRHQMTEVIKNSRTEIDFLKNKNQELVEFYEKHIESISNELKSLRDNYQVIEAKANKLNRALERVDHLENELILSNRHKTELMQKNDTEMLRLEQRISDLTKHNQKIGMEHSDLQLRTIEDQAIIEQLKNECQSQKEQIESLRFMWTNKNNDYEKMKSTCEALERLNIELSSQLNQLNSSQ